MRKQMHLLNFVEITKCIEKGCVFNKNYNTDIKNDLHPAYELVSILLPNEKIAFVKRSYGARDFTQICWLTRLLDLV